MVGMRSAVTLSGAILCRINRGIGVIPVTTGLMIGATIGHVVMTGIVGVMMVGAARIINDLVKRTPLEVQATRLSLLLSVDLGVRGLKGVLLEVKALLLQDPLPVERQQPQEVLRGLGELATARLPHLGRQYTPHAKDPVLVGKG